MATPSCLLLLRATAAATLLVAVSVLFGAGPPDSKRPAAKRSLPPAEWDKETLSRFPENPLSRLKGPRPALRGDKTPGTGKEPGVTDEPAANSGALAWSKIIAPETVGNEIKAWRLDVANSVKNPGAFKGGGNKKLRQQYSVLAAMFGITAQYDQPIRWKQVAAGARDAFSRAAANAKAADDNTFTECKSRSRDLEELIGGGTVEFAAARKEVKWNDVAERRQLMSRLDLAYEKRLRPAVANAKDFANSRDLVQHEAEIIAALGEVIGHEGYESADDAEYKKFAVALRQNAMAVAAAAKQNNHAEAQKAAGEMSKACTNCHGGFK